MTEQNKKIAFFAMPRTASTFMVKMLIGIYYIGHANLDIAKNEIEKSDHPVFCFVRNPFSRLVSAYNYIQNGGRYNAIDLAMQEILFSYKDFAGFCKDIRNATKNKYAIHFFPQHEWIYRGGVCLVEYGHYESLQEDYQRFSKKFGFSDLMLDRDIIPSKVDYEKYYDKETERIVANYYKRDFQLFNYNRNILSKALVA